MTRADFAHHLRRCTGADNVYLGDWVIGDISFWAPVKVEHRSYTIHLKPDPNFLLHESRMRGFMLAALTKIVHDFNRRKRMAT